MDELSELVRAAQRGDHDAFGHIVTRFQRMAYAVSCAMLGDAATAQDAAQEAFIEAYLCLPALREPAAFPGWFRRIVVKQCDRQFRRARAELPLDEAWPAGNGADDESDPSLIFDQMAFRQAVRQAIAGLPHHQRLVTTLFYLNGFSQQEIVDFLGLPATTVKKQLFDARKKLRARMAEMKPRPDLSALLPTQDDAFKNKVLFFLALKAHDLARVQRLLDQSPELMGAAFEWGVASEGYYWPLGYTAMHWAAATNDQALLKALLERGAEVNAASPRDRSTPLHAAAFMRWPEAAALLLENGADPDAQDQNGYTPLHLAARAGQVTIASALLQHGATVDAKDSGGHTPADWAAFKNAQAVLDVLSKHCAATPRAAPRPPLKPNRATAVLETGVKIIDLCAPFRRGGRNALFTPRSGVGKMVTVNCLIQAMATHYGGHTIWLGLEHGLFTREGLELEERGAGLDDAVTFVLARQDEPASYLRAAQSAVAAAEQLAAQHRDVMLLVASPVALADGVQPVLEGAVHDGPAGSMTLVYYGGHTIGAEPEAFVNLDAAVAFEHWRAQQDLWPTIDVLNSRSALLNPQDAGERHTRLAQQTRRLLRRHQDLVSMPAEYPRGMDGLPVEDDAILMQHARLMHAFLTQQMPQTELFTHRPSLYVPLSQTLDGCEAILAGRLDHVPPDELLYTAGIV
ncbi:MAG: sigma-70 family RNA polymerase sigma factor [Chloroflexi bacterium]|nr:sigma-70 family RNA polymerase sigma factor [Chloroflexota bacterium]